MRYKTFSLDNIDHYEHRVVMKNYLGRKLLPKEVVHHLDGNPSNNNIENLFLCEDQKEHFLIHKMEKGWSLGYNAEIESWCGNCKKTIPLKSRCKDCQRISKVKNGWNTRHKRPNKWKDNLGQQYRRIKKRVNSEELISWLK